MIVSKWDKFGIIYRKTAKECTPEKLTQETWAQLKAALSDTGKADLHDADLQPWFIDPAVTGIGHPNPRNREQLLVHPAGTLYHRSPRPPIPNFFLT